MFVYILSTTHLFRASFLVFFYFLIAPLISSFPVLLLRVMPVFVSLILSSTFLSTFSFHFDLHWFHFPCIFSYFLSPFYSSSSHQPLLLFRLHFSFISFLLVLYILPSVPSLSNPSFLCCLLFFFRRHCFIFLLYILDFCCLFPFFLCLFH
jgi:hypothetical protein